MILKIKHLNIWLSRFIKKMIWRRSYRLWTWYLCSENLQKSNLNILIFFYQLVYNFPKTNWIFGNYIFQPYKKFIMFGYYCYFKQIFPLNTIIHQILDYNKPLMCFGTSFIFHLIKYSRDQFFFKKPL